MFLVPKWVLITCASAAVCGTSEAGGGAGPAAGEAAAPLGAGVDTVTSSSPGIDANWINKMNMLSYSLWIMFSLQEATLINSTE